MAAIGRLYRPSTPRWFSGFNAHAYRALLSRCLRYPKTVFALALCCMGMTCGARPATGVRIAAGGEAKRIHHGSGPPSQYAS